jgi:NAD(P)-dependent dehydrogenase (short-subunit alcohol dehydrogenase family)
LSPRGWHVFATVRSEEAGERLQRESDDIVPVRCELRDRASIESCLKEVAELSGGCLAGLVNNAAQITIFPLELMNESMCSDLVATNLIAPLEVIQNSLPLLRAGQGRIVNISSVECRLPTVAVGLYSATKAGLRAISETLSLELLPWAIPVVHLDLGVVGTPALEKARAWFPSITYAVPAELPEYHEMMRPELVELFARFPASASSVARRIETALTSRRPRRHSYVGLDAKLAGSAAWLLPRPVVESLIARALRIPAAPSPRKGALHGINR